MRPRMSCMAISAGMSCPSSCARGRGGESFAGRASDAPPQTVEDQQQGSAPEPVSAQEPVRVRYQADRGPPPGPRGVDARSAPPA